jgi:hypothetical protein
VEGRFRAAELAIEPRRHEGHEEKELEVEGTEESEVVKELVISVVYSPVQFFLLRVLRAFVVQ